MTWAPTSFRGRGLLRRRSTTGRSWPQSAFGGAIVYAIGGEKSAAIPIYFIAASLAVGAFSYAWFRRRPPALRAPGWCYVVVVLALEVGAYLGGSIEGSRAVGAWVAVGLAFVAYGALEHSLLIALTGMVAALAALVGLWSDVRGLGVLLEIVTGGVFAVAAWRLRGPRREQAAVR